MNKLKFILLAFMMLTYAASAQTENKAAKWTIDPVHSRVQFTVTHLVISEVTGNFQKFEGEIISAKDDFTDVKINFTAEVKSITTENEKRDNHLKSADFFDAEKYPQIKFVSTSFKKISDNKYKLIGNFTMKDVTKPVELAVTYNGTITDPWGNPRAGFKITGTMDRFNYNLKWNSLMEAGGAVVGKNIDILVNVEVVKQKAGS